MSPTCSTRYLMYFSGFLVKGTLLYLTRHRDERSGEGRLQPQPNMPLTGAKMAWVGLSTVPENQMCCLPHDPLVFLRAREGVGSPVQKGPIGLLDNVFLSLSNLVSLLCVWNGPGLLNLAQFFKSIIESLTSKQVGRRDQDTELRLVSGGAHF